MEIPAKKTRQKSKYKWSKLLKTGLLAESITDTLVRYRSLEKWDGKLSTTMVPGTATPFIGVK